MAYECQTLLMVFPRMIVVTLKTERLVLRERRGRKPVEVTNTNKAVTPEFTDLRKNFAPGRA